MTSGGPLRRGGVVGIGDMHLSSRVCVGEEQIDRQFAAVIIENDVGLGPCIGAGMSDYLLPVHLYTSLPVI